MGGKKNPVLKNKHFYCKEIGIGLKLPGNEWVKSEMLGDWRDWERCRIGGIGRGGGLEGLGEVEDWRDWERSRIGRGGGLEALHGEGLKGVGGLEGVGGLDVMHGRGGLEVVGGLKALHGGGLE